MLFDTIAEYDAEIAAIQADLKESIKKQAYTGGGAGGQMHSQRGDVRAIKEYLELLSKEREVLKNRTSGGGLSRAQFERER